MELFKLQKARSLLPIDPLLKIWRSRPDAGAACSIAVRPSAAEPSLQPPRDAPVHRGGIAVVLERRFPHVKPVLVHNVTQFCGSYGRPQAARAPDPFEAFSLVDSLREAAEPVTYI